jgi:hypothetical protein
MFECAVGGRSGRGVSVRKWKKKVYYVVKGWEGMKRRQRGEEGR